MRELFFSSEKETITSEKESERFGKTAVRQQIHSPLSRVLDISVALILFLMLLPIFAFVAVWIKWNSPGPIFYRGRRIGKDKIPFFIIKFRTMYEDEASYRGARVTAKDDPRITPVGKWLRDTKLNELPQIWNVLVGDMSLVGPRPEDPEIVANWPPKICAEILSVRPGITSPASVIYRNEEKLLRSDQVMHTYLKSIMPTKLRLDQLYVRHRSLWVDFDVLIWTLLVVVVPGLGNYQPPEKHLLMGPITQLKHRYFSWFTVDLITTFIAFALAALIIRIGRPLNLGWLLTAISSLLFALLFAVTGALIGVHNVFWSRATATDIFDLVPAAVIPTIVALVANYFLQIFPYTVIALAALLAFLGFSFSRYRLRLFTGIAWRLLRLRNGPALARERALIIGGGRSGQLAAWLFKEQIKAEALHIVGFIDDDLYKQGIRIKGIRVIGQSKDIPDLVEKHDVGLILFAIHNIPDKRRKQLYTLCQRTSARIVECPDFLATLSNIVTIDNVESAAGVFMD